MASAIWPVEWPSNFNAEDYDPAQVEAAEEMAVKTLRALTLNRVGLVQVTVEPCPANPWTHKDFGHFTHVHDWFYTASQHLKGGCGGHWPGGVRLIAPVHSVEEILIDGEPVDLSQVQIMDGRYLVFKDRSRSWPSCGGPEFTVSYTTGYPASAMARYAAGVMAMEFLWAMTGDKKCNLPPSVTDLTRQGVSMTFDQSVFPEGFTGIKDVDSFLYLWNPYGLRTRPAVYSPDLHTGHAVRSAVR